MAFGPQDFDKLRASLAKTRRPVAPENEIRRVRVVFKCGFDAALIDRLVRCGASHPVRLSRSPAEPRLSDSGSRFVCGKTPPAIEITLAAGYSRPRLGQIRF